MAIFGLWEAMGYDNDYDKMKQEMKLRPNKQQIETWIISKFYHCCRYTCHVVYTTENKINILFRSFDQNEKISFREDFLKDLKNFSNCKEVSVLENIFDTHVLELIY